MSRLSGRRAAAILYSGFPSDPRPRRAVQALADAGVEMDVVCLNDEPDQPRKERQGGIRVTRLPMVHRRGGKLRYVFDYARFTLQVFLLLSFRSLRRRYDLIHVHTMPDALVFAALVPKIRGAGIILDLHDPMPELFATIYGVDLRHPLVQFLKLLERWSIAFADVALTPTETFRRLFCSRSCAESKMHVVMNTPDETIFRFDEGAIPGLDGDPTSVAEFRVMYHGLIVERHGLATAVEAIALLAPTIPGLVLEIYGRRSAYLDGVERLARDRALTAHVRYRGWRRLEDIPGAIRRADVGVIPSSRTPFTELNLPTRVFEYLTLGKPVVVPATRGIREYFDETEILFFEPDQPEDLARVLRWVYEHPDETGTVVQRGRDVYMRHAWSKERARFLGFVGELFI